MVSRVLVLLLDVWGGGLSIQLGAIHQWNAVLNDICPYHIVVSIAEYICICLQQPSYPSELFVDLAYLPGLFKQWTDKLRVSEKLFLTGFR